MRGFTNVNIMAGFKKTGVYPLNPSEVNDRQIEPSKVFHHENTANSSSTSPVSPVFSPEKEAIFRQRYEENYDLSDPEYVAWLKINHPEVNLSAAVSDTSSNSQSKVQSHSSSSAEADNVSKTSSGLSEILVLPQVSEPKRKRKQGMNSHAVCITDDDVLDQLKLKETEKEDKERAKEQKMLEREEKKREKEEKKREREEKKKAKVREREEKKKEKVREKEEKEEREVRRKDTRKRYEEDSSVKDIENALDDMTLSVEDEAICPKCGALYSADGGLWICCDECDKWYDLKCTGIKSNKAVPNIYICDIC